MNTRTRAFLRYNMPAPSTKQSFSGSIWTRILPPTPDSSARSALSLLVVVVSTLWFPRPILGDERGPSTEGERRKAVALVLALENDPLHEGARESRGWLVAWLSEVPDITVEMCPALLGKQFESDRKYAAELSVQQLLSSSAYLIQHQDRARDKLAIFSAGVEGVLKAYEAILAHKPKARFESLDSLIEARNSGRLEEIIALNMRGCT